MTGLLSYRFNFALERILPERRIFLRSDTETRFIRLRPSAQAAIVTIAMLMLAWTIAATAMLIVDSLSSGSAYQQMMREQATYETRLNALSAERDARASDAASAQKRFNVALKQVSQMQSQLLISENRATELKRGLDALQGTLQQVLKERDDARTALAQYKLAMAKQHGAGRSAAGQLKDISGTLDVLSASLAKTAAERDAMAIAASTAKSEAARARLDTRLLEQRNQRIFAQLDKAVSVSMKPMSKMFKSVGIDPSRVLAEVRSGYSAEGGPLQPISVPSAAQGQQRSDIEHANKILAGLEKMNLYRIASQEIPIGLPLRTRFVETSPFGYRRDPFTGRRNLHPGEDMAGAYGSPIYTTGDGIVIFAGWGPGYGRHVIIRHAFGIKTVYGHMSKLRVTVGERVSRGQRIGDMGSTGRSTGNHLHYEVRVGNTPVSPTPFIKAANYVF